MKSYFKQYDENTGEPRSILSGSRLKRALEFSLEIERCEPTEEERFRRQAEAVLDSEEATWRERDARIARGEVDENGRALK